MKQQSTSQCAHQTCAVTSASVDKNTQLKYSVSNKFRIWPLLKKWNAACLYQNFWILVQSVGVIIKITVMRCLWHFFTRGQWHLVMTSNNLRLLRSYNNSLLLYPHSNGCSEDTDNCYWTAKGNVRSTTHFIYSLLQRACSTSYSR